MKKVLILSGSPRKGGNSDILCDEFARGAKEAGNEVEKIRVADRNIAPCKACYFCQKHGGRCVMNDGMSEILQKIIDCDTLVLSSPVYCYSICAQLKAVIDRTLARWTEIANKSLYYIVTSAESDRDTLDTTLACFHGFARCINGYDERGTLYGKGVHELGDVLKREGLLRIAYEMGESV